LLEPTADKGVNRSKEQNGIKDDDLYGVGTIHHPQKRSYMYRTFDLN
jgi:hypothetical protein